MQHGKEADFSSEMFRVGGDGAEGFRACPEEDAVDHAFVLKGHGGNLIRNGKDEVIIGNGKQLGHARGGVKRTEFSADSCPPVSLSVH